MQGGMTILDPVTRPTEPTAIEKLGRYFICDAVPTCAVAAGDAVFVGFGDGQVRIFWPICRCRNCPPTQALCYAWPALGWAC